MPEGSLLLSGAPYHILSYGTLLGTNVYFTFVNATVAFKRLERSQFSILQQHQFPIYFGLQTALPVVIALTYPGSRSPFGSPASGLGGLFDAENRWGGLVPVAAIFITGLANLVVLMPSIRKIKKLQELQEKKDGKKAWEPAPHSQEMMALKKKFGARHGISSVLNLANVIASVAYGISLSARL